MQRATHEKERIDARITELVDTIAHGGASIAQDPRAAVAALLDALIRELRLDFACARTSAAFDHPPTDLIRLPQNARENRQGPDLAAAFQRCLEATGPRWPFVVSNPIGDGHVSIAVLPLGDGERFGRIVAGSGRADFPSRAERSTLEYAVREAASRLHEATWKINNSAPICDVLPGDTPPSMDEPGAPDFADDATAGRETTPESAPGVTAGALTGSAAPEVTDAVVTVADAQEPPAASQDEEPADVHAANAALQRIIRRSKAANEVVSDMRAFLKRRETRKAPLQVLEVIEDAVSSVQEAARNHQITLRIEPAVKLPPVIGERIQLQQLIVNLVMNGIEAMFDTPRNRRTLVIHARKHGTDAVIVRMRDSGKGLEPQERKRVFEPFYTTKPDGRGMGLAISRTIVEAHGGRLWASANDDCGETFQFTLPIARVGPLVSRLQIGPIRS